MEAIGGASDGLACEGEWKGHAGRGGCNMSVETCGSMAQVPVGDGVLRELVCSRLIARACMAGGKQLGRKLAWGSCT